MRPPSFLCMTLLLSLVARGEPGPSDSLGRFDFLGHEVRFPLQGMPTAMACNEAVATVHDIRRQLSHGVNGILPETERLRKGLGLCDWFHYQLIRRSAEAVAPKSRDYRRYTIAKWMLLSAAGYGALLRTVGDRILLYVHTTDNVYNLPLRIVDGMQYVCLNFHDYGFSLEGWKGEETLYRGGPDEPRPFSFVIDRLPDFPSNAFKKEELSLHLGRGMETIAFPVNISLGDFLKNYPVTDYSNQFNIPMSRVTRDALVGSLRVRTAGMSIRQGIEYLLQFTRNVHPFATDTEAFGREKRLCAEETLLYGQSDCEDRAALFFRLVKELYDLPMLVISSPEHVTVAVRLEKPVGRTLKYGGLEYTLCEPTPQSRQMRLGETVEGLLDGPYEVTYAYMPVIGR